jgi:hypothetical protein
MLNNDVLTKAATDLKATEVNHIVKIASVLSRLRSWYNSLFTPEYNQKVSKLKSDSAEFKVDMDRLGRYINEVSAAIDTGDIDRYNISLEGLKEATISLSKGLTIISQDADMATAPQEARTFDQGPLQVIFRPNTLQNDRVKIPISNALISVGVEKTEVDEILADPQFLKDIEEALMHNSDMVGSAVEVKGGKNQPKRVGEMWVTYQTGKFNITNYPVAMTMRVVLTDLSGRENDPRPTMSVTRVINVAARKITTANIDECIDCDITKQASDWFFDPNKIETVSKKYNWGNYVSPVKTPISKEQFVNSVKEIWPTVFSDIPITEAGVGVLWAQAALETGNFKHMYNYNLGNVKATIQWSQDHKWTSFPCSETIKGKKINFTKEHPMCFWRSHSTLSEGIKFYLSIMGSDNYKPALLKATQGDASGFIHELKRGGYFTADVKSYSKSVASMYDNYRKEKQKEGIDMPEANFISMKTDIPKDTPSEIKSEVSGLMNYFKEITANPLTDVVKQSIANIILPRSEFVIKIKANNNHYPTMIEYASILSSVLENTIDADTNIHSDGSSVEVSCSVAGSMNSVIKATSAIEEITSLSFSKKYKMGLFVFGSIKNNTISKFACLNEFKVDRERRKFYLSLKV